MTSVAPTHPSMALLFNNTTTLYVEVARCDEALAVFEKELKFQEASRPWNHFEIAITHHNHQSPFVLFQ